VLDGLYRLSEDLPEVGSELYAVCHQSRCEQGK